MVDKYRVLDKINHHVESVFKPRVFAGRKGFVNAKGVPFTIFAFPGENAICVEYADSEAQACNGLFPWDGRRFYLDDYKSFEELLGNVMREINDAEL